MLKSFEVVLGLLIAMVALVAIARRINIPYPILLVLGGLVIGLFPVSLESNLNPIWSSSCFCRRFCNWPGSIPR